MAYATSWVYVNHTENPKAGEVAMQQLAVVRSDGVGFCDVEEPDFLPLSRLGVSLDLPELPPSSSLWSARGMVSYIQGERSSPTEIFSQLVGVVNQFIDFSHSLADQKSMCELVALFILATWFLEAFDVVGYLWPNGERGSGKTILLLLIARLAFLGLFTSASGSFASIRDLAECGATLCFDDAELLTDPRKSNPDLAALLLSGNHRDNLVTLKGPNPPRGWKTRFVNTFAFRAFSAIRIPDPVLASRTIIIPLVRTVDRTRDKLDPLDDGCWTIPPRQLVDRLWALAVENLPFLRTWFLYVGDYASLHGRALQPWRGILAVAAWLESKGITDLWSRMDRLSVVYQEEKLSLELSDLTILVIRAVAQVAISAICANSAIQNGFVVTAKEVSAAASKIADQEDLDMPLEYLSSRTVGRILAKLRLREIVRPQGRGSRRRWISHPDLISLLQAYNLDVPSELQAAQPNRASVPEGFSASPSLQPRVCYACHTSNWIAYPDGSGYFCGTCHPPLSNPGGPNEHA